MTDIDWLAVSFAVNGTPMRHLTDNERAMAVRRMIPRMVTAAEGGRGYKTTDHLAMGLLTAEEIGRRIDRGVRAVYRTAAALPPAVERICPVCHEQVWMVGGLVEAHPDRLLGECPMTGHAPERWDLDRVIVLLHRMADKIDARKAAA